ncbi:MAG: hypothetical protein J0L61_02300 [Planctomycetes bacterium]|nr:hypothetical protein [Planctomycetota bacterium]
MAPALYIFSGSGGNAAAESAKEIATELGYAPTVFRRDGNGLGQQRAFLSLFCQPGKQGPVLFLGANDELHQHMVPVSKVIGAKQRIAVEPTADGERIRAALGWLTGNTAAGGRKRTVPEASPEQKSKVRSALEAWKGAAVESIQEYSHALATTLAGPLRIRVSRASQAYEAEATWLPDWLVSHHHLASCHCPSSGTPPDAKQRQRFRNRCEDALGADLAAELIGSIRILKGSVVSSSNSSPA